MLEEKIDKDTALELITVLAFCDNYFINKIPNNLLIKINDIAADSNKNIYLDENKKLVEQDITYKSKDLISIIYSMFVKDSSIDDTLNIWLRNDK